jgi:hypothetical protein
MHAGPKFLIWFGTTPQLTISEQELIREVLLSRAEHFKRYIVPPLIRQFEGMGLTNIHSNLKWKKRCYGCMDRERRRWGSSLANGGGGEWCSVQSRFRLEGGKIGGSNGCRGGVRWLYCIL